MFDLGNALPLQKGRADSAQGWKGFFSYHSCLNSHVIDTKQVSWVPQPVFPLPINKKRQRIFAAILRRQ
jgi:hypothetical protein